MKDEWERDNTLEINVRSESKIVEVWLTREEKQDARLREQLKPLYQKYKAQGYLTAVFESGEEELWDAASDLLCYNRRRIAQMEVEQEKQCGMAMGM